MTALRLAVGVAESAAVWFEPHCDSRDSTAFCQCRPYLHRLTLVYVCVSVGVSRGARDRYRPLGV